MAAGEGGQVIDTAVEIVASGSAPGNAAISSGAMTTTASSSLAVATYKTRNFRTLIFDGNMSATPTAGDTIDIYERALNISDTTDDANVPDATYKHRYVGSFIIDAGSTAQVLESSPIPVKPYDVEYYFFANTASVNVSATWTVDAIHWSYNASQS